MHRRVEYTGENSKKFVAGVLNHLMHISATHSIYADYTVQKIMESDPGLKNGSTQLGILYESSEFSTFYHLIGQDDVDAGRFNPPAWVPPWETYEDHQVVYIALRSSRTTPGSRRVKEKLLHMHNVLIGRWQPRTKIARSCSSILFAKTDAHHSIRVSGGWGDVN